MNIERPHRVTRCYTQRLEAPPARVFPLLCPVREAEWIEGWHPERVISESGVAERDCVFVTATDCGEAVWYVTRHDAAAGEVEMIRYRPGVTVDRIHIALYARASGCNAIVTYSLTSFGPEGDRLVAEFSESFYAEFMRTWERRLNHFLTSGRMLTASEAA
jgi:hypothetical protein